MQNTHTHAHTQARTQILAELANFWARCKVRWGLKLSSMWATDSSSTFLSALITCPQNCPWLQKLSFGGGKKKKIKDFPLNSSVAGCGRDKLGHPVKLEECFTFRIVSQLLILQTVLAVVWSVSLCVCRSLCDVLPVCVTEFGQLVGYLRLWLVSGVIETKKGKLLAAVKRHVRVQQTTEGKSVCKARGDFNQWP